MHLPSLITDLAFILVTAGFTTLIFKRLKQPVVLGYLLAGFIVGPNFEWTPTVVDAEGIKIWAEIGVIFLLFGLGLEFSFKKLVKVGGSAGVVGIIEVAGMCLIGYTTGKLIGWSHTDSLYLAAIVAVSSTTIIFRSFEELGLKTQAFTHLVMGVLIVEDLVAVLLLVLLTTLAVSKTSAGGEIVFVIGKLIFFLSLWFLLGIYLLPTFFKRARKWITSETLLIGSIGLCLAMVVVAGKVGFSAALGAFVMGSILSETMYGEHIEKLVRPVKQLFGAIFFVSVGMLIDIELIAENVFIVLILAALVIFGKLLFVTLGALAAGKPLSKAIQAGTSMTQIGEFSFIIASLGLSLKVVSPKLYPIAVGVSVLTTFTTPYLMGFSSTLIRWANRLLPASWLAGIDNYSAGSQVIKGESEWKKWFAFYLQTVLINGIVVLSIILLTVYGLQTFILRITESKPTAFYVSFGVGLLAILPFLYALVVRKPKRHLYKRIWLNSRYNRGPLVIMELSKYILAIGLLGLLVQFYFSLKTSFAIIGISSVAALFVFRRFLNRFYGKLERRFVENLKGKDNVPHKLLAPWDAHLSEFRVGPQSPLCGLTLKTLQLREEFGINIVYIDRGYQLITTPAAEAIIFPHDRIGVVGTDEQLKRFSNLVVEDDVEILHADTHSDIVLEDIVVDENNRLQNKTISHSGIREKTNGLIVGIERDGERILNPPSDMQLRWNDIVWIAGSAKKIRHHYKANS